jgi:hypothetical protein
MADFGAGTMSVKHKLEALHRAPVGEVLKLTTARKIPKQNITQVEKLQIAKSGTLQAAK